MSMQTNKKLLIIFVLIGLIVLLYASRRGDEDSRYPSNVSEYEERGSYKIDPETILSSLSQGDTEVFIPLSVTPGPDDLLPPDSFPWTQSDYLKIADALHRRVWKEPLDGWNINYLTFSRNCQDNPVGFDIATITLYKVDRSVYTLHRIEIFPLAGEVAWGGETALPRPILSRWREIDLAKQKITAEDALQIAEEHGGKAARTSDKNDCRILVEISSLYNDSNWKISYYFSPFFEVLVDPYTGKHKILRH